MLPLIAVALQILTVCTSLLTITNTYRKQNALVPLTEHPSLARAAVQQANAMCARKSLVHNNLSDRLAAVDFVGTRIGENIARSIENDEQRVFEVWLKSDMHKDNIAGDYEFVGVGKCVDVDGYFYYVEIFGKRARDDVCKTSPADKLCEHRIEKGNEKVKTKRTIRLIIDRNARDNTPTKENNSATATGYGINYGYNTNSISYSDFLVYYDQFLKNYLSSFQAKDDRTVNEINEKLKSIDEQLSKLLGKADEKETKNSAEGRSDSSHMEHGNGKNIISIHNSNDSMSYSGGNNDRNRTNDRDSKDSGDENNGSNDGNGGSNHEIRQGSNNGQGNESNRQGSNNGQSNESNRQGNESNNRDSNAVDDASTATKDNNSGSSGNSVKDNTDSGNGGKTVESDPSSSMNSSAADKPKNNVRVPIVVSDKSNEKRRNVLLIDLKDLLESIGNIKNVEDSGAGNGKESGAEEKKKNGEKETDAQQNKVHGNENGKVDDDPHSTDARDGANGSKAGDGESTGTNDQRGNVDKKDGGSGRKNGTENKNDSEGQKADKKEGIETAENNSEINLGSDVKSLVEILKQLKEGKNPKMEKGNTNANTREKNTTEQNDNQQDMNGDLRFVIKIGNNGIENENEIGELIDVLKKITKSKKEKDSDTDKESDSPNDANKNKPKDEGQSQEDGSDEGGNELILKELVSLIGKLERIRTGESAKDLRKEEEGGDKKEMANWVKGLKSIIEGYKEENKDNAGNKQDNHSNETDDKKTDGNKNGKNAKDSDKEKDSGNGKDNSHDTDSEKDSNGNRTKNTEKNDKKIKTRDNGKDSDPSAEKDTSDKDTKNERNRNKKKDEDDSNNEDKDDRKDGNGSETKESGTNTGKRKHANVVRVRRRYNPFNLNQTKILTKLAELCRLLSASDNMNGLNYKNVSKLCIDNENRLDDEVYGDNEQIEIGIPLYYGAQLIN